MTTFNAIRKRFISPSAFCPIFSSNTLRFFIFHFSFFIYTFPLQAQTQWYDYYADAQEAVSKAQWETAIDKLNHALEQKANPQPEVETYALKFVDYLPYFWRGVAHFNLGEMTRARNDFAAAEKWNAANKSRFSKRLKRYRAIVERLLSDADSLAALKKKIDDFRKQNDVSGAAISRLDELAQALEKSDFVAAQRVMANIRRELPAWPQAARWERAIRRLQANSTGINPPGSSALDAQFETGLTQFLAGNFAESLRQFLQIEAESPGYRQATDWIRKTRAEMQRLGQKPDTLLQTIVQRDTITVAPVIAFSAETFETRAATVRLSGFARDDQGISHLEFTLNGKPFVDENGAIVQIIPPSPDEARGFSFTTELPLQPGENQVVAIAQDVDISPHRATFPLRVSRKPPLYREPLFLAGFGVILLLSIGAFAANILIKRRIAFVNRYNPYIAGAPVRNEKMFFGREILLRRIVNTLHNNSLMLHGPRRIGKTSLLHQLKKRLEQEKDRQYFYVPVYIDLQGTPEARFFSVMMHDIAEGCETYFPKKIDLRISEKTEAYSARDFSADLKKILEHLNTLNTKTLKLVLLIDEVDELNNYSARTNQKLRSIFMKTFAENLVAVMAGSHIRKRWESEGSPWYNFFEEIAVEGIDRPAAEALVRQPVKGIFFYDDAAVKHILEISELIPYRIQKICVSVLSRVIEQKRRRISVDDVESVCPDIFDEANVAEGMLIDN